MKQKPHRLFLFALASLQSRPGRYNDLLPERRRKEIAVRKVLGAGEFSVLYLLTRDFSVLVIAGIVIALPVSGYIVHYWLQGFAYRIAVAWWYFAGAGMLALLLAWVTVGVHAFRAMRLNSSSVLKDD